MNKEKENYIDRDGTRINAGGCGRHRKSFTVVGFPGREAQNMGRVDKQTTEMMLVHIHGSLPGPA